MQNAVRYGEKVGNTLKKHKGKAEVKMLKSFMHHSMAVKAAACRYTD
jgi:hypothetical protein